MSTRSHRQNTDAMLEMTEDGKFRVVPTHLNDEPPIVTFSRAFVMVVSILTCLGGLALTGGGAYIYIEFNSKFSGLLTEQAAIGALVAGILIALVAGIGIFGALHDRIPFLVVYLIISFALLVSILSILGLFVDYINTVTEVSSGTLTVFTARQVEVNDFFASAYTKCCVQNPAFCTPGSSPNSTDGFCKPVPYCVNKTGSEACYAGDYGVTPSNPPKLVLQEFCGSLIGVGIAGRASVSTGACGSPNGATDFIADCFNFVNQNIQYPYICVGLLAGIILLELIFTLILIRHIRQVQTGTYENKSARRRLDSTQSSRQNGSNRAANTTSVAIPLDSPFRFEEQEIFDHSSHDVIKENQQGKHKSGGFGNPIFKNMFAGVKKNNGQVDVDV